MSAPQICQYILDLMSPRTIALRWLLRLNCLPGRWRLIGRCSSGFLATISDITCVCVYMDTMFLSCNGESSLDKPPVNYEFKALNTRNVMISGGDTFGSRHQDKIMNETNCISL